MVGISLTWRELTDSFLKENQLLDRVIQRTPTSGKEVHFLWRDRERILPVWQGDEIKLLPWGKNKNGWIRKELAQEKEIPTGWNLKLAEIPVNYGYAGGVWFQIVGELQAAVIWTDHEQVKRVHVVTEEASHYYQIMTGQKRMPVILGRVI